MPESKANGKTAGLFRVWAEAEELIQIALILPCSAFIGWLGGALIDKWLHQTWIGLAGIVFGGASGLVYVIRLALAASKNPALQDEKDAGQNQSSDQQDQNQDQSDAVRDENDSGDKR